MQHILCPVDIRNVAHSAVDYAVNIAIRFQSHVVFMSVLEKDQWGDQELKEQSDNTLNKLVQEVCSELDENFTSYSYLIKPGNLVEQIINYSKENEVDLIVMGTRGTKVDDGHLFHTNTVAVIERSSCAVLSVPRDKKYAPLKNIVYATNFEKEDRQAILDVISLATPFNAYVNLFHMGKPDDFRDKEEFSAFKEEIVSFAGYKRLAVERKDYTGDLEDALNRSVNEAIGDLLVLLYRQRGFLAQIFHKSLTKRMSQFKDYPLLIYPVD